MSETVEYLGTIIETCVSSPVETKAVWHAGETVIIREVKGIRYYRIIKLLNRSTSMVRRRGEFKYYEPEWFEIKGK